jgi:hypothetical protein
MTGERAARAIASGEPVMDRVRRRGGWGVQWAIVGEPESAVVCYACNRRATVYVGADVWRASESFENDEPSIGATRPSCHTHHALGFVRPDVFGRFLMEPCDCELGFGSVASSASDDDEPASGSMAPDRVSDEGAIH